MPRGDDREQLNFVMSFLEHSEKAREFHRAIDREVLENYMVLPQRSYEYDTTLSGRAILKDVETHTMVETLLAFVLLSVLNPRGFIGAEPVGREDAQGAVAVQKLLESAFRQRGNYRSLYVWAKDAMLFGTGIMAPTWAFEIGERPRRFVEVDPFTGQEFVTTEMVTLPVMDHLVLEPVDLDDFYPDPGADTIEKMVGAARRYVVTAEQAMGFVRRGRWKESAVKKAIGEVGRQRDQGGSGGSSVNDKSMDRSYIDRPGETDHHTDYNPMIAYEWWGETPFEPKGGGRHRRITLLQGHLVETRKSPLSITRRVPFYEKTVNPIQGRFRGIAPGAVARFTQSFSDALLMCLADSVVRKTNSPIIYDRNARVNPEQLAAWSGPIATSDVNSVKEVNYNPPLQEAFGLLQYLKQEQRTGSSAQDAIAGRGFGTKRLSASEASLVAQGSEGRPSMMAELWERDTYPALAEGSLELSQQFIANSEDLARRIGTLDAPVSMEQLQAQWDIKFVGSSKMASKELQLQFLERGMAIAGSIPGAAPNFPWSQAFVKWLELADLRELEAMVANPNGVEDFLQNAQLAGAGSSGNGNQASQSAPPSGLLPAQLTGLASA